MAESWTVLKVLKWTTNFFVEKQIESGRLEAEVLLADTLGIDRVGLYLNYDKPLNPSELALYRERVGRRVRREPLQYILGETEFWSLPFKVNPGVLIPRADTEVLVEEALKRVSGPCSILDVGTGSGAIAVSLAHELTEAKVTGLDLSPSALEVAAANAELNGVGDRVDFSEGDLAELPDQTYDLIVSNPPYIPEEDMATLMPEVRDHEPQLALRGGGRDGLDAYRSLVAQPNRLRPGGWLIVEVGVAQAADVSVLFETAGFCDVFTRADYGGIDRVVGGRSAA